MKRKALITATAVLLVAVMCLATASYAWFTSGSATSVSSLKLHVTASDGGIEIAPAKNNNGSYTAGAFGVRALTVADFSSNGILPTGITADTAGTLNPVSTDLVAVNGDFDFYPSLYNETTRRWTTQAESTSDYVLISFYARAPKAGSTTLNLSVGDNTSFIDAAKVAVDVVDNVTLDADGNPTDKSVLNGFDKPYTFSTDLETYYGCAAANAVTYKDNALSFEPDTADASYSADKFTANVLSDNTWAAQNLTFAANETKLITVALWIEGMDDDCSGSWTADSTFVVSLGDFN